MSLPAAESVPSLTASDKSSITVDTQGWDSENDDYSEDEVADFLEWEDTGEATEDAAEDAAVEESSKNDSNNSTFMARILGPSANKAGLQSTDKAMITRVIYEASKGTPFFENERRKDQALRRRIEQLLERKKRLEGRDLTQIRKQVDMDWRQLEVERDLSQTIVHIDMDAFYAAVEELDNPELKTKPMAVGGNSMLSTANYVARKFGIRSAMPGYIAKKLCPELIIIPVNGAKYKAISKQVQAILERYDPQFLAAGIDESYLNLTSYMEETGMTAEEATHKIRQEIFEKTNLTASAGIAANKRLAKICSDINKPNGQYTLKNDRDVIMKFVRELPVRQLNGIGRVTEQLLGALGVTTGNDMHEHRVMLKLLLSSKSFEFISRAALGLGKTDLSVQYDRKSISVERTFRNMSDAQQQLEMLKKIADKLASNLDRKQIKGSTITLKLKRSDFTILSRSRSLAQCIFTEEDLYTQGKQLLEQEQPIDIRLMGLRISALQDMRTKQINKSITKFFRKPSINDNDTNTTTNISAMVWDSGLIKSTCPVCNTRLEARSEAALYCHVEHCLRRQTEASLQPEDNTSTNNVDHSSNNTSNNNSRPKRFASTSTSTNTKSRRGRKRSKPTGTSRQTLLDFSYFNQL